MRRMLQDDLPGESLRALTTLEWSVGARLPCRAPGAYGEATRSTMVMDVAGSGGKGHHTTSRVRKRSEGPLLSRAGFHTQMAASSRGVGRLDLARARRRLSKALRNFRPPGPLC